MGETGSATTMRKTPGKPITTGIDERTPFPASIWGTVFLLDGALLRNYFNSYSFSVVFSRGKIAKIHAAADNEIYAQKRGGKGKRSILYFNQQL